jgi:hypothetical protein
VADVALPAATQLDDVHSALTGSASTGFYNGTLVDFLWDTLTDLQTVADAQRVTFERNGASTGGPTGTPATQLDDVHAQLLGSVGASTASRWGATTTKSQAVWDRRYRTCRELVQQCQIIAAALAATV